MQKPIKKSTPGRVYGWFYFVFRASQFMSISGTVLFFLILFIDMPITLAHVGFELLLLGLYFGVLGRDCAEVCASEIASRLGYSGTKDRFPTRVLADGICALCDLPLNSSHEVQDYTIQPFSSSSLSSAILPPISSEPHFMAFFTSPTPTSPLPSSSLPSPLGKEKVYTLNCKHKFHEFCLRGWTIVGKKDTCPCCSERVALRALFSRYPWDSYSASLIWTIVLDAFRYLVVFNPIIVLLLQFALVHVFNFPE
eukprot:TRINITY_DN237_c2_g1_i1.p1 TRINITY_DN237_c2_g1~~TRINITY_DN237_c2_g1_i1.p1  ORF type:complete len:253 (+),score=49.60 TRINITY_DN237_c2_g1_i1:584-1342(+)